jgi:hypothetical protein
MKPYKTILAAMLSIAISSIAAVAQAADVSAFMHPPKAQTASTASQANKEAAPIFESEIDNVSYQTKVLKGKEIVSSSTIYTYLRNPTTFETSTEFKSPGCEFKDIAFPVTTTIERKATEGLSMLLIPVSLDEDGLYTALTLSVSTVQLDDPLQITDTCAVRVGDTNNFTMTRVANLPWDKATSFTLKDGSVLEITPHRNPKPASVVKTKA